MFQKNRFLFVLLFAVQSLFAQIPQGFNYQATVRNQTGELLTNEYVGIRFHIVQGTEQNNPVYSELHYESTDDLGSLHLMIGQGAVEAGAFNQIDWSLGDYHMGIEINTGSGFIDMGTTQLMSVPFALYALNSGTTNNASLPQGTNDGDVLRWNSATNSWTVEDVSVNLSPVYLAENGITVKAKDWAGIGAKGMLNGVEYTVVDIRMLRDMLDTDGGRIAKDVTTVCTSRITGMYYDDGRIFGDDFNQDISTWDVSNVTNMSGMFESAQNFNQDLSAWDVRNVRNMREMFQNASSFNQDLSAWDVRNVTNMSVMFESAQNFNQDLSAWDVRNVTTMEYMFYNAQNFNQDLSAWDVRNVIYYYGFNSYTSQWTLPRPNFNGNGSATEITEFTFTATASGNGNTVTVLPSATGATSFEIDFGDNSYIVTTPGTPKSHTYLPESANYTIEVTALADGLESVMKSEDFVVTYEAATTLVDFEADPAVGFIFDTTAEISVSEGTASNNSNSNETVGKVEYAEEASGWQAARIRFGKYVDLSSNSTITMDLYNASAAQVPVTMKLFEVVDNDNGGFDKIEVTVDTEAVLGWQTLTFDFNDAIKSGDGNGTELILDGPSYGEMNLFLGVTIATGQNVVGTYEVDNIMGASWGADIDIIDSDGDGVVDSADLCPDVAAEEGKDSNKDGCTDAPTGSSSDASDDFEGTGNLFWLPDGGTTYDDELANPYSGVGNTSATVLKYNDNGDQYANINFNLSARNSVKFDLTSKHVFTVNVYVPKPTDPVSEPKQLALKLQDGSAEKPWEGQTEVIQPYEYDQWQTLTFDFSEVSEETKYSRIVVQFNGENNYELVEGYIDDILLK